MNVGLEGKKDGRTRRGALLAACLLSTGASIWGMGRISALAFNDTGTAPVRRLEWVREERELKLRSASLPAYLAASEFLLSLERLQLELKVFAELQPMLIQSEALTAGISGKPNFDPLPLQPDLGMLLADIDSKRNSFKITLAECELERELVLREYIRLYPQMGLEVPADVSTAMSADPFRTKTRLAQNLLEKTQEAVAYIIDEARK